MKTDDVSRLIDQRQALYVDNADMSEECVHKTDKSIHEWVGLTPQEFNEIKDNSTTIGYAILQTEAKLKEKNT